MKKLLSLGRLLPCLALPRGTLTACGDSRPLVGIIQFGSHASLNNCYTGILAALADAGITEENTRIEHLDSNFSVETATAQVTLNQDGSVQLQMGATEIGEDSVIGPNTRLTDTVIVSGCTIDETVAIEARIDDDATCGPRAYLRPGAHLCEGAKAGTHVEIKKSTIGRGS